MERFDYAAHYQRLAKKYPALPEYTTYNAYVETSFLSYDIYDDKLIARFFRKLLERRVESLASMFQTILFPNSQSLVAMEESSFFNEDDKKQIAEMMRQCMILYRTCSTLNFTYKEAEECAKITELMDFLVHNQPFIDGILDKVKNTWSVKDENKKMNYMG